MTPGVLTDAAEKNLEKQMGCMAGFFQLFDRHQILNGKRVYSAKRLPSSSPGTTSPSPSDRSDASPTSVCSSVKEVIPTSPPPPPPPSKVTPQRQLDAPEPTTPAKPAAAAPATCRQQTLPLPVFSAATTATAWKLREAPRLSLDSRIFDGKPTRIFPREIRTSSAGTPQGQHPDADFHDRQRRSPSVVARLMGLDVATNDGSDPATQNEAAATTVQGFGGGAASTRAPELRRSASESRACRDLPPPPYQAEINPRAGGDEHQQRRYDLQPHGSNTPTNNTPYFDPITAKFVTDKGIGSQKPPLPPSASSNYINNTVTAAAANTTAGNHQYHAPPFPLLHRKSFFDAHDIFPEPAKLARSGSGSTILGGSTAASSMYGEIEKRLRMRGIDEPAKDLETLKQILEALQLKGLLHQTRRQRNVTADAGRNLVYDTAHPPLILMKPISSGPRSSPSPSPRRRDPPGTPPSSRLGGTSPRKNAADPRVRRDRVAMERGTNPGNAVERRGRCNALRTASDLTPAEVRSPRSPATARRQINSPSESRRSSPAQSPRSSTTATSGGLRRAIPDPTGRSPRTRKPAATADSTPARLSDESSTVSESSYSTISQFEFERAKVEEYREGRNLLERCDKLLNSIAELTDLGGAGSSSRSMEIQQPSPVSVLDSSAAFYCDDTTSATASTAGSPPSPCPAASKRCLDFFKDAAEEKQLQREQCWTPMELHAVDDAEAGDGDFLYVAEVLCASAGPSGTVDEDVFYLLEKRQLQQQCHGDQSLRLHRRLVFDTVVEIADKKRQLSTWEAFTRSQQSPGTAVAASTTGGRAVWEELKQIRECGDPAAADDFFEAVCGVLKKDMAMDSREAQGWGNRSVELSEAVLDIERLIFKDLVAEAIWDLAAAGVTPSSTSSVSTSCSSSGYNNCRSSSAAALGLPRRKLVF